LDVVLPGPEVLAARVVRTGDNQWLVGLGDLAAAISPSGPTNPGLVAAAVGNAGSGFVARLELDVCGAWVTMACTADLRPLVVRRAGWVDERGDVVVARDRVWPEDRVGLGPGDAVAVVHRRGPATEDGRDVDPVAELLLGHIGSGARGLVDARPGPAPRTGGPRVVAGLAVPSGVAGAGPSWVAEATGVAEADLVLPGYPQGDSEPGRWKLPPSTPRRATFLLNRDPVRLGDLRGVLGRLVSSWRLGDRLDLGILTLLTTELATNSLVHTETAATATISYLGPERAPTPGGSGPVVRVEVYDGSSRLAERRESGQWDTSGRGIALIEELAVDWGSVATPSGKRTWFDMEVSPGDQADPSLAEAAARSPGRPGRLG